MTTPPDDDHLLAAWRASRDEAAFRTLCERHAGMVTAACRRLGSPDAEEASQAVFLVLARRPAAVRSGCVAGWLAGTARRVVAHQRRAAARRRQHEEQAAMADAQRQHDAAQDPAWSEARRHLDAALGSLSDARREAIVRFYLEGKPQAAVALELGCSPDAVKTRVHEGVQRLRAFFARRGIALGASAIAVGLAGEAAPADPAAAATLALAVLSPAAAAGADALARGATTAMTISSAVVAASATLVLGCCLTVAVAKAGEAPPTTGGPADPAPAATAAAMAADPAANAALHWWRAFEFLPAQADPIWKLADTSRSQLPDPVADALFTRPAHALDLLRRGAAQPACSWGVDSGREGAGALLPYLGHMRQLVRLGLLRARWHAQRGDTAAATDDLLTIHAATRLYPGSHPLLIDAMVANALQTMTLATMARLAPGLGAEQRQRLATAIAATPSGSTTADALDQELALARHEVERVLAMPSDERIAALRTLIGQVEATPAPPRPAGIAETVRAIAGTAELMAMASDANLAATLPAYAAAVSRWQTQLRLPPPQLAAALAAQAPEDPPLPILLRVLMPAWRQLGLAELGVLVQRHQLLAGLDALDHGTEALAHHPDPLTGAPFRSAPAGAGFSLLATIPGQTRDITLRFGEAPVASAPATAAPPAEVPVGATDF